MPSAPDRSADLSSRVSGRSASVRARWCAPGADRSCAAAAIRALRAAASRGRGGADAGQRGSGSDQNAASRAGSSCGRLDDLVADAGGAVGAMRTRFGVRLLVGVGIGVVGDDRESRRSARRRSPRRSCRDGGDGVPEPGRRACRSWQATRQPRWVGWCRLVRSFLAAIPIGSLATSIPHGRLDEGGSVSFAIEFAQNEAFP